MTFPPILQSSKQPQSTPVVLKRMRDRADITFQVPEVVPADVAVGSGEPVLTAHRGPLGCCPLRAEKIVIGEAPAPDGSIPECATDEHLVLEGHLPVNLGYIGAGVFVFEFRTRISQVRIQSRRILAPDGFPLAEPFGDLQIDTRNGRRLCDGDFGPG